MADTGVAPWRKARLGDLCRMYQPETITKKQMNDGGAYPVYGANGVMGRHDRFNHDASQLIIGCRGACGTVHVTEPKSWITGNSMVIQPINGEADLHYLRYFFSGPADLPSAITGAAQPQITQASLKPIAVPLPPLEEQKRIVAVLDQAFTALDRARALAEANLADAEELFAQQLRQVFLSGRQGWEKGSVENLCTIRSGTTVPKSKELPSGLVPYVKVADMNLAANMGGIVTSSRFLDSPDAPDRSIIPVGATIFPKRGGAIMTNKKRLVLENICADLNVMAVIPGNKLDASFLHFFFLSIDMRKIGSGSSIPQINNYDIYPLELLYPPDLDEQRQTAEELRELRDQTVALCRSYLAKLGNINDLRQSLLQKAFAGELT